MRLINTTTLKLETFEEPFPEYAILSHRWEGEEVSFQEFVAGTSTKKKGYQKIKKFCELVKKQGYEWGWVDTCGIDKTSSAELSEAINSMYKWYENSAVCFAYLSDVDQGPEDEDDGGALPPEFQKSLWFTRGWTLQELIAPRVVKFHNSNWAYICEKAYSVDLLSMITGIDEAFLLGKTPIKAASVAKVMSWASKRVTTRREDIAYCLLGLFGINMPLLYGEGNRAFVRLQEEILKHSSDQSIFAWNPLLDEALLTAAVDGDELCGILSPSPGCFAGSGDIVPQPTVWDTDFSFTNRGVKIKIPLRYDAKGQVFLARLSCKSDGHDMAIELHAFSNTVEDSSQLIRRIAPIQIGQWDMVAWLHFKQVYLATDSALWEFRYANAGLPLWRQEYHFRVLLHQSEHYVSSSSVPLIYPGLSSARPRYPNWAITAPAFGSLFTSTNTREIANLNPLKSGDNCVAIHLKTTLSSDLVVMFGFKILQDGSFHVDHLWKTIMALPKHVPSQRLLDQLRKRLGSRSEMKDTAEVAIDMLRIEVDIVRATGWWAKTSLDVIISFHPTTTKGHSESTLPQQLDALFSVIGAGRFALIGLLENLVDRDT